MKKIKILFVDDDIILGNVATLALNEAGYDVHFQTSLSGIVEVLNEWNPQIIILDVEIGEKNGLDIAPELKRLAPEIPILFVSSHTSADFVVKSMEIGAVGYLKKPFDVKELIAYVSRFIPANSYHLKEYLNIGSFQLNLKESLLTSKGEAEIKLTTFEYKLLLLLAKNINKVVTREHIEETLWGRDIIGSSEYSINNYVVRLRRLLSTDNNIYIESIPKVGYKLKIEEQI